MKQLLLLTMFLTILGADQKSELIIDIEKSLMATCCWSGTVYDHGNKENLLHLIYFFSLMD